MSIENPRPSHRYNLRKRPASGVQSTTRAKKNAVAKEKRPALQEEQVSDRSKDRNQEANVEDDGRSGFTTLNLRANSESTGYKAEQQDSPALSPETTSNSKLTAQILPSTIDCIVCGDETQIVALIRLSDCEHEPEVCGRCFAQWIASELKDRVWHEINCPSTACSTALKHHEVQQYADPVDFARCDMLAARSALNNDPNFRWCRAPQCNSGQIHENGVDGNIFRCYACGFKVCIVHEDTWHEGETCEQHDARIANKQHRTHDEEKTLKVIEEDCKVCPGYLGRPCGWRIFKTSGCDHMTCTQCKYQFCYICLASYARIRVYGNSEHKQNCKHHRSAPSNLSTPPTLLFRGL